jgi:hypothetical protein
MNPKNELYDKLWTLVGKKVGYGIDCDVLTDQIVDLIQDYLKQNDLKEDT